MKKILIILCILALSFHSYTQKIIRVGAFNYYPAIFKDSDDEIKGFYVDAFRAIEHTENVKFEFVFGSWNEGLERIKDGSIDVMVSVAYSDERSNFMDYSKIPLLTVWGEVYTKSISEIDGILDLENKNVAIMKGDMNAWFLKNLVNEFEIHCTFIEVDDFDQVFKLISSSEVQAGVVNNTFGAPKSREYGLRSTGFVFNPFDIYFTVKKNKNKDVLELLNSYLEKWKHDKNSIYNISRQKWSHEKVGTIQFIPRWLTKALIVLAAMLIIFFIFIILLRYQVKKASQKILKSEALFKAFMENFPAFVYVKDASLNHIYKNKMVDSLTPEIGPDKPTSAKSIFDKETVELLENADRKILNGEIKNVNLEYSCIINGKKEWLHDRKFLLEIPGEKPLVGGISIDISQQKETEENLIRAKEKAEESDRLKSSFLQNISHEIRTPLNAIMGFSGLILKSETPETKKQKFAEMINFSCNKLMQVITDLIEISQIQTNQTKINEHSIDLHAFIEEISADHKGKAFDKGLEYNFVNNCRSSVHIITDSEKLRSIIRHLIDNAIKFTVKGSVNVTCNLNDNDLQVEVSDTGIGIAPDLQSVIFEPFRQSEVGTARNYGGNGLGLSIVKAYVDLLHGTILLTTEGKKGSVFTVTLPVKSIYFRPLVEKTYNAVSIKTVLIAEDEYYNFQYLAEILSEYNLTILHAEDGQQAVDMVNDNSNIDLILMDIKMPVMDGVTAAGIIKRKNENIPILAQTAYALDREKNTYKDILMIILLNQ